VQVIVPGLRVELPMEDLPAERRDELIQSLSLAQASEVFDFFRGPLFRVRLLRFGPADHVVLVTVHHIIADGWSVQVLLQEVLQLYDAFSSDRPSPLAELPIQYADYTLWQRDYLQGAALTSLAAYWRKQLAGVHSPALPFDRPWRAEDEHRRNRRAFRVSAETRGRLERIGRAIHTTPFMLTLAAYQVLLHSYGDSDDVAVAVPIANRDRAETQGLIGCFLSTLILRSGLGGDCTFREALLRVRKTVIEGFDHQDLPIELMIRELGLDYQPLRYPFTHVLFSYHESSATGPLPSYIPLALSYRPTDLNPQATRFALELTLTETSDGLAGLLEYDAALFDPETVEKIEGDFTRLLAAIATNPELRLSQLLPPPTHAGAEPAIQCRPPAAEAAWETADSPVPWSSQRQSLVPLRREGSKRPLFLIHGLGGYVAALVPLTRGLAVDCPVYGLQAQGLDAGQTPHDSIGAMADFYLREIRQVQPSGPYLLGGWSMGGIIALEAARQLGEAGEAVSLLAMLDSYLSLADFEKLDLDDQTVLRWIAPRLKLSATELRKLPLERQWERIEEQAMRSEGIGVAEIRRLAVVCKAHLAAICRYVRRPYPGPAVLFTAGRGGGNPAGAWSAICPRLRVEPISGDHYTMLRKPDVDVLAERLGRYLQEALAGGEMTRNE
jgi:thioesterase domain-containing protein